MLLDVGGHLTVLQAKKRKLRQKKHKKGQAEKGNHYKTMCFDPSKI